MLELDATTRSRLVDLRRLLLEGQVRSQDRTHGGQLTAVILLDASCEHSVSLARTQEGLSDPRSRAAGAALDQLVNSAVDWQPPALKCVKELRMQRNNAMHHGIVPDFPDVARWSQDAESFVRSVVKRFFGVDLGEVAVSDGIRNDDVRRLLGAAELAFDAGEFAEAKFSAVDAFDAARELWRQRLPDPGVPWYDRREANVPEGLRADIERLRDESEVRAFAGDLGEYLWLQEQHRRYRHGAPVPPEDARRALAFVTEWILRWDEHIARRVNREAEWQAQMRPPVSGMPEARPSIRDVEVVVDEEAERTDPAMVRVIVQIQDIPESERAQWLFLAGGAVSGRLTAYGSRGALCDPDGRLSFVIPLRSEHTGMLVSKVVEGIREADEQWKAFGAAETQRRAEVAQALDDCRDELKQWLSPTSWLRDVDYVPKRDDAFRARFNSSLHVGQRHWLLQLMKESYGDQRGAHRLEVGDDWLVVPVPEDGRRAGEIIASVLTSLDGSEREMAAIRGDLERYAVELRLDIDTQLRAVAKS